MKILALAGDADAVPVGARNLCSADKLPRKAGKIKQNGNIEAVTCPKSRVRFSRAAFLGRVCASNFRARLPHDEVVQFRHVADERGLAGGSDKGAGSGDFWPHGP